MNRRREAGQATVELALCLPLVALLLGAVIEVAMLATDRGRLIHAAREAARVAVVEHEEQPEREAAEAGGLQGLELSISPGPEGRVQGSPLTVRVGYNPPGRVPILGALFRDIELEAQAVMRIERP